MRQTEAGLAFAAVLDVGGSCREGVQLAVTEQWLPVLGSLCRLGLLVQTSNEA